MSENISINGFLSTWEPGPIETELLANSLTTFLQDGSDAVRYLPASYKPVEALKYAIQKTIGTFKKHSGYDVSRGSFKVERNRNHSQNGYELDYTYRHADVNETVTLFSAKVAATGDSVDVTYTNSDTLVTAGWLPPGDPLTDCLEWDAVFATVQNHYEVALKLSPAINISKRLIDWCMDKCSAIDPPNVRGVRWVHNKHEDTWKQFARAVNAASSASNLEYKPKVLSLGLKATPDSLEMLSSAALAEIERETQAITYAIETADGTSSNQALKNQLAKCEGLFDRANELSSMLNSGTVLDQCNEMVKRAQQAVTIAVAQLDANEVTGSSTSNPFSFA